MNSAKRVLITNSPGLISVSMWTVDGNLEKSQNQIFRSFYLMGNWHNGRKLKIVVLNFIKVMKEVEYMVGNLNKKCHKNSRYF